MRALWALQPRTTPRQEKHRGLRSLPPLTGAMLVVCVLLLGPFSRPASATVSSDQSQISQIEQRIASQGLLIQELVGRFDQAQSRLSAIQAELSADNERLSVDRAAQARAAGRLRQIAIYDYITASSGASGFTLLDAGTTMDTMAKSEYANLAAGNLNDAVLSLNRDEQRTSEASAQAKQEEAKAQAAVGVLAANRRSAEAALASDQITLSQVKGNLQALLMAAQAKQAAQQRAAEQAMAAQQAVAAATQAANLPPPAFSTPPPSPGSYVNPLRAISALSPERIDQGVDYSGYGPIYAIGDGVVLNTTNAGWPGGTFITYRLTNGPASGLVVYAAEDIYPSVAVGQSVTPSTVLGTMYEGPDGIETGWADSSGQGYTMAHDYGQFNGSNSTAFGYNFSQLLVYLGAPGGVLQNNPPTGTLPPGWPQW